jgi:uncharacterized protein YlxW (UPF0749 family)
LNEINERVDNVQVSYMAKERELRQIIKDLEGKEHSLTEERKVMQDEIDSLKEAKDLLWKQVQSL